MIALWMLCYLTVGALLALVAMGAEVICVGGGWARRAPWFAAIIGMCALPVFLRNVSAPLPVFIHSGSPVEARGMTPIVDTALGTLSAATSPVNPPASLREGRPIVVSADSPLLSLDGIAIVMWIALSFSLLTILSVGHRRLQRARRGWVAASEAMTAVVRSQTGKHTRVWSSGNFGPAVSGAISPQVLIPSWVDELDDDARALLLDHEASHVTARDPLLLLAALLAVVALPWNLPLLFAYRRMHRAVEHDCDQRVLSRVAEPRSYGRLLLTVAERLARPGRKRGLAHVALWIPAPISGMATQASELEARLRALVRPIPTWQGRVRMILAAGVVTIGVLAACSVPTPVRIPETQSEPSNRRLFGGVSSATPKYMDDAFRRTTANSGTVVMDAAYVQFQRMMRRRRPPQDSAAQPVLTRDSTRFKAAARRYPWERRAARVADDAFHAWIEKLAAPHVRELIAQSPDVTPVLWLLLNPDGELSHGSGRTGLYSLAPDRTVPRPPESNPATFMTADRDLGISCDAFARKFPLIREAKRPKMCGMTRMSSGNREVIVVFGMVPH